MIRWVLAVGTPLVAGLLISRLLERTAHEAGIAAERTLEVVGTVAGREVDITVRDYGRWRPERADERGRGLALMRALMDTVEVTPSPEGKTVRLRRRLSNGDGSG